MSERALSWLGGKWPGALLAALGCGLLYSLPAALTASRAVTLPLLAWEQAIPFWPVTVWAYVAQYPLLVAVYARCRDLHRCRRFLRAALGVQALAALAYLAWPLRYPRPALPAELPLDALTAALVRGVLTVDAPLNCCPSLHVTSCLLCVWMSAGESRAWRGGVAVVALASMASTLTFKQHYAMDLLAAVPLAAAGWWLAGRAAQH